MVLELVLLSASQHSGGISLKPSSTFITFRQALGYLTAIIALWSDDNQC